MTESSITVGGAMSMSLDGFIAGVDDSPKAPLGKGGERLFEWYFNGDTPSRHYGPPFRLSAVSAELFDARADRCGAVISGRRTYDVSNAWGGKGPLEGVPLFVLTHRVPRRVPRGDIPYTFVTNGIERAVEQARAAAARSKKIVMVMGGKAIQHCLRAGLMDEIEIDLVPVLLGRGVPLFHELGGVRFERTLVVDAPGVTHLRYHILNEGGGRRSPRAKTRAGDAEAPAQRSNAKSRRIERRTGCVAPSRTEKRANDEGDLRHECVARWLHDRIGRPAGGADGRRRSAAAHLGVRRGR